MNVHTMEAFPLSSKHGQGPGPIISSSPRSWTISPGVGGWWSSESCKAFTGAKLRMRSSSTPPPPYTIEKQQTLLLPLFPNNKKDGRKSVYPIAAASSSSSSSYYRNNNIDEDEEEDGSGLAISTTATSSTCWVERYIPEKARPYAYLMRLHHLTASALIFLPCLWSIAFATQPGKIPDVKLMALFSFVGVIHHGIGCTINDILDRDIDAKVKRTRNRPLASGVLTLFQGLCFLGIQMLICYCLLLQVNDLSRKLWLASLLLVFTYPLTKRITFWPQAYLGLAVNFFNLCGWSAVKGGIDLRILLPLCTAGTIWTIIFDTFYAHQDKKDDAEIGVKSLALLLGNSTKIWLYCFAAACIGALALTGSLASIGWPYYATLVAGSCHFVWQISTVDLDSPADCLVKFDSNKQFGAIILCGILLGRLYP